MTLRSEKEIRHEIAKLEEKLNNDIQDMREPPQSEAEAMFKMATKMSDARTTFELLNAFKWAVGDIKEFRSLDLNTLLADARKGKLDVETLSRIIERTFS